MACYASEAVKIAKEQIGYKEKGNNWNKYAEELDRTNFYNGKKQNVAWCDIFFDWCIWSACGKNTAEAEKVLCQPKKSAGAGCKYSYQYYKAEKRTGKTAKIGAQIFFGSSEGSLSHTGIVVDIKDGKVITVEGNTGNAVKQHCYSATSSKIFGYGYPRYTAEEKPQPAPEPSPSPAPSPKPAKLQPAKYMNPAYNGSWKVTASALNMRYGAGTDYPIITTIPKGKHVRCYGYYNKAQGNDWLCVVYGNNTGYCCKEYLVKA